jgi:hypothetical protein
MKIAVMQPYIFPYLGYFQLANYCDKFVFYDDANFIKGGFINRNNILAQGEKQLFTLPVIKASSFSKINELNFTQDRKKALKSIEQNYRKAPHFAAVMPIIREILQSEETRVAHLCKDSVNIVFDYLGIELDYCFSSSLDYNKEATAAEKLCAMCQLFGADQYYNMAGGKLLYKKEEFKAKGIELSFLQMGDISYSQGKCEFVKNLSIIDALMWNSIDYVKALLNEYVIS